MATPSGIGPTLGTVEAYQGMRDLLDHRNQEKLSSASLV